MTYKNAAFESAEEKFKKPNGGNKPQPAPVPTEDDLAQVFAERHADRLRYCHHHGGWIIWTGTHWCREDTMLAFHWARELAREFNVQGKASIAKTTTASGVERYARADRAFAVTSEIWDRDPFLLGTPGGTVDLRTGSLRAADQRDFISKATAVTPAPEGAVPELWLKFVGEATKGDADLAGFLQQMAGYCLTGDTGAHALFFVHGGGGEGKTTFVHTLSGVMGDYARVAPMEAFTASQQDRHPTDLAMLRGARLVTAQEIEPGRAWAEARIKALTGGDPITARFMHKDFFTYQPQFKLLIVGNHKPALHSVDQAARRRFHMIPLHQQAAGPRSGAARKAQGRVARNPPLDDRRRARLAGGRLLPARNRRRSHRSLLRNPGSLRPLARRALRDRRSCPLLRNRRSPLR